MASTKPPVSPEPDNFTQPPIELDIVDFDEDPTNKPFDRTVVSDDTPYYFIFTNPDSEQKYNVSQVDTWTIIDIVANLADRANVRYYARNTPPLYNIIAGIINREPKRPKPVLFPIIEASGLVTHPATFPLGPFLLSLLDHAKHMKFRKKHATLPVTEPARALPCNQSHHRRHEQQNTQPHYPELVSTTSLQDTRTLNHLLTSSSTTGTLLAHSMISYGQSLERNLQQAHQMTRPACSIPYRQDNHPRYRKS
ncbi:hypothetical protein BDN71DRAFT_1512752 [Pleurotus eryngii]|uniref:Uncharacterized protein n=1 Tax=Pleurotus eryngii TaxID=5323 RepID=A0A9P6D9L0_PLEER|nr:hypothetical protein BDN71DRAFT_1512752 [Pleurotus eryngii]